MNKGLRAAIFLAAGQGSRLRPLTEDKPKCLLPVGEQTILDTLLPYALMEPDREIVVVGGYCAHYLEQHLREHYPEHAIKFVVNENFMQDVNILSLDVGVNALQKPEHGYTVVETDLLMSPDCWDIIRAAEKSSDSFWVTSGRYNPDLTGGIVYASSKDSKIEHIDYVPVYDSAYEGWHKMVGILSVSPKEVEADRKYRQLALERGFQQYYMVPWIEHLSELSCKAVDLGSEFVRSFNTSDEYDCACNEFLSYISKGKADKKLMKIEMCTPDRLKHIEGYSKRRVDWLTEKIIKEGVWTKPLALDLEHDLVLDGQHRMEVALRLGLKQVPVVRFDYSQVPLHTLRAKYQFDWKLVTERALKNDIYPYKTVKHDFVEPLPVCSFTLKELGYGD